MWHKATGDRQPHKLRLIPLSTASTEYSAFQGHLTIPPCLHSNILAVRHGLFQMPLKKRVDWENLFKNLLLKFSNSR